MNSNHGPIAQAQESANQGETSCEVIAIRKPVTGDSVAPVSPVVSLAVSPASHREKPITEVQGSKPSNKSGNGNTKPNCYECKHQWGVPGSAHSSCRHPAFSSINSDPAFQLLGLLRATDRRFLGSIGSDKCNVVGNAHGIKMGWFMHPLNFDPVWLESCTGYEAKP